MAHGGLPFPRANMTAWVVVAALVAAAGVVFPLLLLGHSAASVFASIRDGGGAMYLLLLSMPLTCAGVAVLSGLGIRGRAVPPAAIAGVALIPSIPASAGVMLSQMNVIAAISGGSVDSTQRMRMMFEGTQESMASLEYGAAICACALGAAAIGCAGIAASVDRVRVGTSLHRAWVLSPVITLVGLVASVVVTVVSRSTGASPVAFAMSVVALLIVALASSLAARSASALRDWHDPREAKAVLGAVLTAAIASALALWLLDRAAMLGIERVVLGACGGAGVSPSMRGRILMEGKLESRALEIDSVIHVVTALAAFAPALVIGSAGGPGIKVTRPWVPSSTIALGLAFAAATELVTVHAHALGNIATMASMTRTPTYPVAIPSMKNARATRPPRGRAVIFTREGLPLHDVEEGALYPSPETFAADKDARVDALIAVVESKDLRRGTQSPLIELVTTISDADLALSAAVDPEVRAMLGPEPLVVAMSVGNGNRANPKVVFLGRDVVVESGRNATARMKLDADLPSELHRALADASDDYPLEIDVDGDTTIGELVTVVDAASAIHTPAVYLGGRSDRDESAPHAEAR